MLPAERSCQDLSAGSFFLGLRRETAVKINFTVLKISR